MVKMCKKTAMLHEFIDFYRDEIVARCRTKVSARSVPPPTAAEIEHGVPVFLGQLAEALRSGEAGNPEIGRIAVKHGRDLLLQGLTVSQVVHDYGDVCQTITEMAVELNVPISAQDFRTLNGCLDNAIAGAVTEYGRGRNQSTLDGEVARGSERLGFLAHELRNLTSTAIIAFEVLKTGNVGIAGNTGAVLHRSLSGIRALIGQSLDEVRLTQEVRDLTSFQVSEFIQDVAPIVSLEARAAGVTLTIPHVEEGVTIQGDRRILVSVLVNLIQNALKFTKPHTTITLRVITRPDRVFIEVEDECGGLLVVDPNELFIPFEQRNSDRSGLGLGLAYCRWAIEANNGRIHARSLPGRGCVFTIDIPRLPVAVDAAE
jgi:signal transduction histidine kinase